MKNILKGYITTLIGLAICYITYTKIEDGSFSFVWEGIAGFGLGVVLILTPDDFVKIIKNSVNKFSQTEKEESPKE